MDATILVNRTHRLPRKAIPQTLVEPEIIFDRQWYCPDLQVLLVFS